MSIAKLRRTNDDLVTFHCPGCDEEHTVRVAGVQPWTWNSDLDSPTIRPSILLRSGHYAPGWQPGSCWCTYNAEHQDDPAPFVCKVCHSFVTAGSIQFLDDCTHKLAGKTVELPDMK